MTVSVVQLRRLLGRTDVYAVQLPDGQWRPVDEPLHDSVLRDHIARRKTVGTYVIAPPDQARTLVLDYDTGEESYKQAFEARQALTDLGVPQNAVGVEDSGGKGHHVWVVLAEYVQAADLRRLGRATLALAGHPSNTEVFPKADSVREGAYGNLVKLAGGVHQKTGKPNNFVTPFPIPMRSDQWERVKEGLPEEHRARTSGPVDNRFPCLGEIQQGVTEGGRNIQLFHLATMMRRAGAGDDLVLAILEHVNSLGDPLDELELDGILRSSAHSGPICSQLPQDLQDGCAEHCIRERLKGLSAKPGQLRHASVGEHVVVKVLGREGDIFELGHDDIETARGRLRGGEK